MKNQILVRIFFVLLFVSVFSATYYFWPTKYLDPSLTLRMTNSSDQSDNKEEILNQVQDDSEIASSSPAPRNDDSEILQPTTYKLLAGGEQYSLELPTDKKYTVYQLMQLLSADSKKSFLFTGKEYPGMGYFVESINGVKNNAQENKFWIYYINGKSASVGISQYVLKEGDAVEWKFESSNL